MRIDVDRVVIVEGKGYGVGVLEVAADGMDKIIMIRQGVGI